MAIYSFSASIGSRSTGQSAVAHSAYINRTEMRSNEDNTVKNYTSKEDIIFNRVLLPQNAPTAYENPENLWNEVERVEKSVNAQLYRSFVVALPKELTDAENIQLAKDFCNQLVNDGMCVDLAIHKGANDNIHMHITTPLRGLDEKGKFLPKRKDSYVLDKDGNRIPVLDKNGNQKKKKNGQLVWKTESKFLNDWHTKEKLQEWRKSWEVICNRHLKENGINQQIDCRSNKARGLDEKATIHEGYKARGIVASGGQSDRVDYNTAIKEYNQELRNIKKIESDETLESVKLHYLINKENNIKAECEKLEKEIIESEKQLAEARQRADLQNNINTLYPLVIEFEKYLKRGNSILKDLEANNIIVSITPEDAQEIEAQADRLMDDEGQEYKENWCKYYDLMEHWKRESRVYKARLNGDKPSVFNIFERAEWEKNEKAYNNANIRVNEYDKKQLKYYELYRKKRDDIIKMVKNKEQEKTKKESKSRMMNELNNIKSKMKDMEKQEPRLVNNSFRKAVRDRHEAENEKKRQEEQKIREAEQKRQTETIKKWVKKNGVPDGPEGGSR